MIGEVSECSQMAWSDDANSSVRESSHIQVEGSGMSMSQVRRVPTTETGDIVCWRRAKLGALGCRLHQRFRVPATEQSSTAREKGESEKAFDRPPDDSAVAAFSYSHSILGSASVFGNSCSWFRRARRLPNGASGSGHDDLRPWHAIPSCPPRSHLARHVCC